VVKLDEIYATAMTENIFSHDTPISFSSAAILNVAWY